MQDNDFDKIFSHKFGQLPGSPYREDEWSDLSKRLDRKSGRRWALPLLLPLFGLLAGGNIFWWYQWKTLAHSEATSAARVTAVQHDTIVRKTVVYLYDTVYRHTTVVRHETVLAVVGNETSAASMPAPATGDKANQANDIGSNPATATPTMPNTGHVSANATPAEGTTPGHDAPGIQPTGHTIVQKVIPDSALLAAVPPAPEQMPETDTIFEDLLKKQPPPTKKSNPPLIYLARPRVGVSAFWARPHMEHLLSGSVLGAALRGDVEIARHFRLGAEIAYLQAGLKADETESLEDTEVDIPQPGGDFELKYWETYFLPAFTYALNLRYEIPVRGNWKPWISTGVQACSSLPFEVEFEFENDNNSLELHVPARAKASTRLQGMTFAAGVECPLGEHFRFGVEAGLLRGFGEDSGLLDRQTGLKTTLLYAF